MSKGAIGKRVLIVEDEIIIAMDISNILRRLGYTVLETVSSGEEALESIGKENPDIVLMDIRLAGSLDGIETAEEVRKRYDVPLVFLTAHSDEATLNRVKHAEPYGYLTKPIHERELFVTLETALYRYRADRIVRVSETRYRSLFEQSGDAICICNIDGTVVQSNEAMKSLSGYNNSEIVGNRLQDLFPGFQENPILLNPLKSERSKVGIEVQIRRKDGAKIDCVLTLSVLYEERTSPTGIQFILRDISEQKQAEYEKEALLYKLSERVKELDCLYNLTELLSKHNVTIDEILSEMALIIPLAWQHPDKTCVKVDSNNRQYFSMFFNESEYSLITPIYANGEHVGDLYVYFLKEEETEEQVQNYFMEKKSLMNALARRLGNMIEFKVADDELKKSHEKLRNLSGHLQTVREEERTMIAREIHDELGQALTAMKMDAAWIQRQGKIPETVDNKLNQMMGLIDSTVDTVRRISSNLRPGMLDDLGLTPAIEWFAQEFEERNGIMCRVNCDIDDAELNSDQSIAVYRIFQESMTNVLRHSSASEVDISLIEESGKLVLSVSDNGKGINLADMNKKKSFGIIGMKERAYFCDGELQIVPNEAKGTRVELKLMLGQKVK